MNQGNFYDYHSLFECTKLKGVGKTSLIACVAAIKHTKMLSKSLVVKIGWYSKIICLDQKLMADEN